MKLSLSFSQGEVKAALTSLPSSDLLKDATAEDLRVLICLIAKEGDCTLESLAHDAGCSTAKVKGALAYWQECGVLVEGNGTAPKSSEQKPQKAPIGLSRDLLPRGEDENAAYITAHSMEELINECQRLMGRLFNPTEIAVIVGMNEQLGFDFTYIMTLVAYCAKAGKLTLRYVERMAIGLFEEEITTAEALDAHLKRLEATASREGKLRRLFGMGERALSKKEKECFARWVCDFGYDMDIIGMAYDITVNTQQKAIVSYTDKILTRWHDAGCRSLKDCEALQEKERAAKPQKKTKGAAPDPNRPTSFTTDDFFSRALERSYGAAPDQDKTTK